MLVMVNLICIILFAGCAGNSQFNMHQCKQINQSINSQTDHSFNVFNLLLHILTKYKSLVKIP